MKLELIENPRKFSDEEYSNILDYLLNLRELVNKILTIHAPGYEVEVFDGISREEACTLEYIDEIESIRWEEFDTLTRDISMEIYFPSLGITGLFMQVMEDIKYMFAQISSRVNCMQALRFEEDFKKSLQIDLDNLTYCIICAYRMFAVNLGKITTGLNFYTISRGLDPVEFVNKYISYYRNHRPTITLFEKYPEFAERMETIVDPEYFENLVSMSSLLSATEIKDIATGNLIVDANFMDMLDRRLEESRMEDAE